MRREFDFSKPHSGKAADFFSKTVIQSTFAFCFTFNLSCVLPSFSAHLFCHLNNSHMPFTKQGLWLPCVCTRRLEPNILSRGWGECLKLVGDCHAYDCDKCGGHFEGGRSPRETFPVKHFSVPHPPIWKAETVYADIRKDWITLPVSKQIKHNLSSNPR